ncbi:MAG: phytoene/squalene synthase family protein [Bacteriovoracaceae bacterium]
MKHREVIRNGSKSFSLASLFFSPKEKEASWKLYSWCRYCDDLIDDEEIPSQRRDNLIDLKDKTFSLIHQNSTNFYLSGMFDVIHDFKLPMNYPMDLLRGMEMDVEGKRFQTLEDLEEYCYCVAGTVGLMMCHILGIRDEVALHHAVALGKAMQLTNISRDIIEDKQRGRLYIPLMWLKETEISEEELFLQNNEEILLSYQERLLKRADELYSIGLQGLKFLSLRSSWAVLIAAIIYSDIGRVIRNNPQRSLKKRAIVSTIRKLSLLCFSLVKMIPLVLYNLRSNEVRSPQSVWSLHS